MSFPFGPHCAHRVLLKAPQSTANEGDIPKSSCFVVFQTFAAVSQRRNPMGNQTDAPPPVLERRVAAALKYNTGQTLICLAIPRLPMTERDACFCRIYCHFKVDRTMCCTHKIQTRHATFRPKRLRPTTFDRQSDTT